MIRKHDYHLSPCVSLESARYLTDPLIIREYRELQESHLGGLSPFQQLWKQRKFRLFVLRLSRLALFAIFSGTTIMTVSHMGLWNDIYFWLARLS